MHVSKDTDPSVSITVSIRSIRYTLGCLAFLLLNLYFSHEDWKIPAAATSSTGPGPTNTCHGSASIVLGHEDRDEKKSRNYATGTRASFAKQTQISIQNVQASTRRHELQSGAITVILTGFKRSAAQLRAQIQALLNSTLVPQEMIFYQNGQHVNFSSVLTDYPMIKHIHNVNHNTRFHGRFTAALLATTEYVFDLWMCPYSAAYSDNILI